MDNKELFKSIAAFQADCPKIKFDSAIKYGNKEFKYATLANIIDTITESLSKNKLGFTQVIQGGELKTILFHHSGGSLSSDYLLPQCNNPQDLGKWLTYIKRYQLSSMLGIVAEDDDDGGLKVKGNIKSVPIDIIEKVTLKLEVATDIDTYNIAKKECISDISKYPSIKSMFQAKYAKLTA